MPIGPLLKSLTGRSPNQWANHFSGQALQQAGPRLPGAYGQLASHLGNLQQSYGSGNYLGSYFDLREARRAADQTGMANQVAPYMRMQGGIAPYAWEGAGYLDSLTQNPETFARTATTLAPGLMQGAGQIAGIPGMLGLYGLARGDRQVFSDAQKIMPWLPKIGMDLIDRVLAR